MNRPVRCVVDASVAIKIVVDELDSPLADALFAHMGADPRARFFVPAVFYPECANILWKVVRHSGVAAEDAERALGTLHALSFDCVDDKELTAQALRLAIVHDITVYDASYVALARRTGIPLITADERLARKLQGGTAMALVLGRFEIPPLPEDGELLE